MHVNIFMPCKNGMCGVFACSVHCIHLQKLHFNIFFIVCRLILYMKSKQNRVRYRNNSHSLMYTIHIWWVYSSVPSSSDFNCFKKSKSFYHWNLSLECEVHWVEYFLFLFLKYCYCCFFTNCTQFESLMFIRCTSCLVLKTHHSLSAWGTAFASYIFFR